MAAEPPRTLRPASRDDLAALSALASRALGSEGWDRAALEHELGLAWCTLLVCLEGEVLVGFVHCWTVVDELEVLNLVTAPERRRRGHARALLEAVLARVRVGAVRLVHLEVRVSNAPARALYDALGFAHVGERRGYYADGEDALLLSATLAPG